MRILIVTDLWHPTVNGVVRVIEQVNRQLERMGHEMKVIGPKQFETTTLPGDPDVLVAIHPEQTIGRLMLEARPEAIHIATAGPVGIAARNALAAKGIPFTTAFLTKLPEYMQMRFGVPRAKTFAKLRTFHAPATCVMVPSEGVIAELRAEGLGNELRLWSGGVDTDLFQPRDKSFLTLPRPIHLYVGRVSVEKNLDAFLALDLPGSKLVVGDGPELARLKHDYPKAHFAGVKQGEELAKHYAAADLFVFPSLTDTQGIVILEALASGLPVAALPVTGPNEVIGNSGAGVLDEDLGKAIEAARSIDPALCRAHAMQFSWARSAREFLALLTPIKGATVAAPGPGDTPDLLN